MDRDVRTLQISNGIMRAIVRVCQQLSVKFSWPIIVICFLMVAVSFGSLSMMHVDIDYARRFRENHNMVISMIHGPDQPLYMCGARLLA